MKALAPLVGSLALSEARTALAAALKALSQLLPGILQAADIVADLDAVSAEQVGTPTLHPMMLGHSEAYAAEMHEASQEGSAVAWDSMALQSGVVGHACCCFQVVYDTGCSQGMFEACSPLVPQAEVSPWQASRDRPFPEHHCLSDLPGMLSS